jgi:hypothetical protein
MHELTALDAVRLLCNAIQQTHHLDRESEGISLPCKDAGELMLCDALQYLAFGDTAAVRKMMDQYDEWKSTGEAPWPFERS